MGVLPRQTIDFSVPNPSQTSQLSLPLYQGAGYREDFKTWSLLVSGGFMRFRLEISDEIPVDFILNVCASLVNGQANCPISIRVNGQPFVNSYSDHNANFHDVDWTIPANLLHTGDNEIIVTLDFSATTQLFIKAVTVERSILKKQTIDFSVPDPKATSQLSLPLYQGAGYRSDFSTWTLLVNGGFMKFNLSIAEAEPVIFAPSLCAALVEGKANCPISITVNKKSFVKGYRDENPNFHEKLWTIPANLLKTGNNEIIVSLDKDASTQIFINAVSVAEEK
jgi:hypothetical protein